jgi:hypothetical protein
MAKLLLLILSAVASVYTQTIVCNATICGGKIAFFQNPCFAKPCPKEATCLAQVCVADSNDKCTWAIIPPFCMYQNGTIVSHQNTSITTTSLYPSPTAVQELAVPTIVNSSNSLKSTLAWALLFVFII